MTLQNSGRRPSLADVIEEPLIWFYDPSLQAASKDDLAKDPLCEFDRPMMALPESEFQELLTRLPKEQLIEFV